MKIARINLHRFRLPLIQPLGIKGTVLRDRTGLLVRLESDGGAEGWGEASPLPGFCRESADAAAESLGDILPRLREADVPDPADLPAWFDSVLADASPSARFAMETAVCDLLSSIRGRPVSSLFGGPAVDRIDLCALLAGSPDELPSACRRVCDDGYRAVKLKVGRQSADRDADIVRAAREALGPSVALRLDANRAWTLEQAVNFATRVGDVGLDYVEEPLARPSQLPELARQCGLPLALDETLDDTPAAVWETFPNVRAVVIKPTVLGGLSRSLRLSARAARHGIRTVVSSTFESGVGLRALAHLAAATGGGAPPPPAGLDTHRWLKEDLVEPRPDLCRAGVDLAALDAPERHIRQEFLENEAGRHD